MSVGAINKNNIIEKLCFVRFGGGLVEFSENLRTDLNNALKISDEPYISRQTIHNWFDTKANTVGRPAPSKIDAFRFLLTYIEKVVDYENLSSARKKVHRQIIEFLTRRVSSGAKSRPLLSAQSLIRNSGNNNIVIRESTIDHEVSEVIIGVYKTFRIRFSDNKEKVASQEVLRIYRGLKELKFEHSYLREGIEFSKFEGVVFLIGNMLWLIGSATKPKERLRVITLRYMNSINPHVHRVRWGILCSDTTSPSPNDPVATRILFVKVETEIRHYPEFARENTKFFSLSDNDAENCLYNRFIDNKISAFSEHGGIKPIAEGNIAGSKDMVLRVSQSTLEAAYDLI